MDTPRARPRRARRPAPQIPDAFSGARQYDRKVVFGDPFASSAARHRPGEPDPVHAQFDDTPQRWYRNRSWGWGGWGWGGWGAPVVSVGLGYGGWGGCGWGGCGWRGAGWRYGGWGGWGYGGLGYAGGWVGAGVGLGVGLGIGLLL